MSDLHNMKDIKKSSSRDSKNIFVDNMAGSIAHDINNLLTVVTLNLNSIKFSSSISSDSIKCIENAGNAVDVARRVTRQLFALSSYGVISKEKINIGELLKQIINFIIPEETINCKVLIGENVEYIYADVSQVEQLFQNLILNAVEAMKANLSEALIGIKVEKKIINKFQAKSMDDLMAGEYVHFKVIDNGTGISQETVKKVFEPNFTTSKNGKGFGLYICNWVVKNHGGCIDVESEEGVGTTFNIYFPIDVKGG